MLLLLEVGETASLVVDVLELLLTLVICVQVTVSLCSSFRPVGRARVCVL